MRTKDSSTDHVLVNLWSTLYKLTVWLASLDLRRLLPRRIVSHRTASLHAWFDVLVLDGGPGRGKTMNDLVDRDHELPANAANLNKTLFVCLFGIKNTFLLLLCWEGSKPTGSDHTRLEAQTTCVPKTAANTTYLSMYG